MTAKSRGFTLIELLVVVAILGIIAAIGITSYNGYVSSTKKKSTENVLRQVALAQTEYYSDNQIYYYNNTGNDCTATVTTSQSIETDLLGGSKTIIDPKDKKALNGYWICISNDASGFKAKAIEENNRSGCKIELFADTRVDRNNKC